MIKVTLKALADSKDALQRLLDSECPARLGFRLRKIGRVVKAELTEFEQLRNALVEKHGTKEGNQPAFIKQTSPKWEEFAREYGELLALEVEMAIDPLEIDAIENLKMTGNDSEALSWLIPD